jgi:acyl-CoA synthetase (AMP-forming)/AMP-acid ligase II
VLESDELSTERALNIITALKSKLHPYEVPKSIESIGILPRTSTGKIDYKSLYKTLSPEIP